MSTPGASVTPNPGPATCWVSGVVAYLVKRPKQRWVQEGDTAQSCLSAVRTSLWLVWEQQMWEGGAAHQVASSCKGKLSHHCQSLSKAGRWGELLGDGRNLSHHCYWAIRWMTWVSGEGVWCVRAVAEEWLPPTADEWVEQLGHAARKAGSKGNCWRGWKMLLGDCVISHSSPPKQSLMYPRYSLTRVLESLCVKGVAPEDTNCRYMHGTFKKVMAKFYLGYFWKNDYNK